MRVRRHPADEIGLQIAPMCDVVFLILTFFMLTTQLTQRDRSVPIRLPVAEEAAQGDDADQRFVVTLDARGRFFVGEREIDPAELRQRLRDRFRQHPPLKVALRADAATPARQIKQAIAWSAEAGATEVVLGAVPTPPAP